MGKRRCSRRVAAPGGAFQLNFPDEEAVHQSLRFVWCARFSFGRRTVLQAQFLLWFQFFGGRRTIYAALLVANCPAFAVWVPGKFLSVRDISIVEYNLAQCYLPAATAPLPTRLCGVKALWKRASQETSQAFEIAQTQSEDSRS